MKANKSPQPSFIDRPRRSQTRPYAVHQHNPAGAKLVRAFYRGKHGGHETYANALAWLKTYNPRPA